jgi:hypothetical protein
MVLITHHHMEVLVINVAKIVQITQQIIQMLVVFVIVFCHRKKWLDIKKI